MNSGIIRRGSHRPDPSYAQRNWVLGLGSATSPLLLYALPFELRKR